VTRHLLAIGGIGLAIATAASALLWALSRRRYT
jgi:hypothetical protein